MKKSIKLTGRVTISKSSEEDIKFVQEKLGQGMNQSSIIRQAIKIYRKYETGQLFVDVLKDININFQSRTAGDSEEITGLKESLDEKISSGDWGL